MVICGLTCMLYVFFSWLERTSNIFGLNAAACVLFYHYIYNLPPPHGETPLHSFEGTVSLLRPFCFFSFVMRTLHALPTLGWRFWEFVDLSVGEIFMAASSSL